MPIKNQAAETVFFFASQVINMTTSPQKYTGEQIVVLEGLEPVRKRPAMYIGSTSLSGVYHCIKEIVDNSIDEALAGFAKNIWVSLNQDDSVTVSDDGRGIPVDKIPKYGVSALEIVMTKLHAGGKFDGKAYKISGGLHGVGASVVNALASQMEVKVYRDKKQYTQNYSRGNPQGPITSTSKFTDPLKRVSGTTTTFVPDTQIFKEGISVEFEMLKKSIKERAYLIQKIFFHLFDARTGRETHYYFEGGIVALIKTLNKNKVTLHDPIHINKLENEVELEMALQYNDGFSENVESFVNVTNTQEGGTHLTGFRMALTRAINDYAKKIGAVKNGDEGILGEDTREGLTAIVYIKMSSQNLQFEGQTKTKLGNNEIQPFVLTAVKEGLETYFEEHPADGRKILEKVFLAAKARLAAKAAKDAIIRKGAFEGGALPGKLADCQERDPVHSELFIVEGDSAGGSAKQGRDRKFQAILPLRGKILNTERARLDKIIEFEELKALVIALGMGIGETLTTNKLRYHRIIIMTDADVDGEHIMTLLLTFFYRHLPYLVQNGHLYIAMPPLYKVQIGKQIFYAYTDPDKEQIIAKNNLQHLPVSLQRYKGLGEMNPDQLWETTMNPDKRSLKQITIADAVAADQTFTMLMGDEVPPRKRFIQTHAKLATLDV